MYQLELHRMRSAELHRVAQRERLAREVVRTGRAARRAQAAGLGGTGTDSHTGAPRPRRLPHTA